MWGLVGRHRLPQLHLLACAAFHLGQGGSEALGGQHQVDPALPQPLLASSACPLGHRAAEARGLQHPLGWALPQALLACLDRLGGP